MQLAHRIATCPLRPASVLGLRLGLSARSANPGASLLSTWCAECLPWPSVASRSAAVATPIFVGDAAQVLVVDLAHRHLELARLALQQLAADLNRALALVLVEPVLDLVARARALDEGEPVAAGLVVLLRDDFDDVAGAQLGAQRHHAAVDLGAHAGVAHLGVDGVGKVDRRGIRREPPPPSPWA